MENVINNNSGNCGYVINKYGRKVFNDHATWDIIATYAGTKKADLVANAMLLQASAKREMSPAHAYYVANYRVKRIMAAMSTTYTEALNILTERLAENNQDGTRGAGNVLPKVKSVLMRTVERINHCNNASKGVETDTSLTVLAKPLDLAKEHRLNRVKEAIQNSHESIANATTATFYDQRNIVFCAINELSASQKRHFEAVFTIYREIMPTYDVLGIEANLAGIVGMTPYIAVSRIAKNIGVKPHELLEGYARLVA